MEFEITHCESCGAGFDVIDARVQWNNDKLVCDRCEEDATELDRN